MQSNQQWTATEVRLVASPDSHLLKVIAPTPIAFESVAYPSRRQVFLTADYVFCQRFGCAVTFKPPDPGVSR